MKVVIIEDEALVAKDLVHLLSVVNKDIKVLAILESVEKARKYFAGNPIPDLILSDIQLSDGVSFDIFRNSEIDCPIIFTTAYNEYALSAFRLNSIDYLLKPIDEQELRKALQKFEKINAPHSQLKTQILELVEHFRTGSIGKFKSRFTGHYGKSLIALEEEEVAYFTREEIIFLVGRDNRQVVTDYHSLEDLEACLDPCKFIRANRQYILHLQAIDHVKSHFTGKLNIVLKNPMKTEISVSREKAGEFKRWFEGGFKF